MCIAKLNWIHLNLGHLGWIITVCLKVCAKKEIEGMKKQGKLSPCWCPPYSLPGPALVQRGGPEGIHWGVPGEPEAGAEQEQGDDREHQEVPQGGPEAGRLRRTSAGSQEIRQCLARFNKRCTVHYWDQRYDPKIWRRWVWIQIVFMVMEEVVNKCSD